MKELVGNVLILQMGRPSAVTNVLLATLVKKALNYDCIEEIYGGRGGLQNLASEQFVDLASQQQKNIASLVGTPGAALRTMPGDGIEMGKVADILKKRNIRYLFVIGDSSTVERCAQLNGVLKGLDHEVRVMLLPTSADNDIQLTDHCLGYGSMVKHLAVTVKSIVTHIQSTQANGAITVLELKNCSDEWLLGATAVARLRKDSTEAPHLIIFSKFDEGTFVKNVHRTIKEVGHCVVVVGSELMNAKGENVALQRSAAEHVKFVADANFDVQVDLLTLEDWNLTSCMTLSGTDVAESELCAQKALELAVTAGISGKMITILRADGNKYSSEVSCVDFENISNRKKEFPESWYVYEDMALDLAFFKYVHPLIMGEVRGPYENGLPTFARLK
jgi:6-phosphofructokinase 1